MNCFSWIKLILVLIHDKYWYCNSSYLEVSFSLTISLKFYLSQLKSSSAQIIIMFFIGFSISSYSIGPQATKVLNIPNHMQSQVPSQSNLLHQDIYI